MWSLPEGCTPLRNRLRGSDGFMGGSRGSNSSRHTPCAVLRFLLFRNGTRSVPTTFKAHPRRVGFSYLLGHGYSMAGSRPVPRVRVWTPRRSGSPGPTRPSRRTTPAAPSYYSTRRGSRSEEHTSELQSRQYLVCR